MHDRAQAELPDQNRYGGRHLAALPGAAVALQLFAELTQGECLAAPQPPRFPLTLYGGGDLGRLAREYFASLGHDTGVVIDRNAEALRKDRFWAGVNVMHPEEVPARLKREAQLILCVATAPYMALAEELEADGWRHIVPFYDVSESLRARHPLSNGWFAGPMNDVDVQRTSAVLERWDDDASRAHHLQFLAWRMLRQEWTFEGVPVTRDDRFFIPEVMARVHDFRLFVDAGAHHGVVTRKFADLRGDAFSRIVSIEPDADNFAVLRAMQTSMAMEVAERITLMPLALGADTDERRFHHGLGYASQFSATGQTLLGGVTLDSLELEPDFVKLHLEGAEFDALRGARETIRRHRPVLAVTTYHNADGIWRTPAWLMENLEDYRFLMRLHSWCGTGAVVYALPRERS